MKDDEQQMLKLFEISDSLSKDSTVLVAGSTGRDKAKPCPSPSRSDSGTPENTQFPNEYLDWGVIQACRNSPEAGGLVLESNPTVHLFSFPEQNAPLSGDEQD